MVVAVPNEDSANQTANAMTAAGYEPQIDFDEGEPDFDPSVDDAEEFGPCWTIFTAIEMVPDYKEIIRIQSELDEIGLPFHGKSDGWGVMLDADPDTGDETA